MRTMYRIIVFCLLTQLLHPTSAAPVERSHVLSSIQEIQRQYATQDNKEFFAKERNDVELENVDDSKPEVDVDNIEAKEPAIADSEDENPKESSRKAKVLKSRFFEDLTAQSNKRKNKMFGYFGYYPQPSFPQPMPFPSYYPLEYYDDYVPLESYPNVVNPFVNLQNYQQNMAAFQSMAAIQSMNNLPLLNMPSTGLPNLSNLNNNNQASSEYQNIGDYSANDNLQNLEDEEILSRTNQGAANRRRPNFKNSPIYYIRLPPTPYMFVPGLGYISQPPTIQPMTPAVPQYPQLAPPVTMSPFYNLPINFVSNGKPSGIYQWNGAPSPAPIPQPAYALPYPTARPPPQRPMFRPNPFVQDSKITHLKGPFIFNGRPEEIFLLQNSINPFFQPPISPLNGYY